MTRVEPGGRSGMMELVKPDQVSLDNASLALIEDVGEAARPVNEFRPLAPSVAPPEAHVQEHRPD